MSEPVVRTTRGSGGKIKPLYLYGGAGVVVIGVYLWSKHRAKTSSASGTGTDPNAPVYDPSTDSYYDPSTGGYYTSNPGYAQGVTPSSTGSTDSTGTTPTSDIGTTGVPFSNPTNNVEWMSDAVTALVNNGYDNLAVSVALGKFLAGTGLTQDEYNTVTAALALVGNPPTAVSAPHMLPAGGQGTKYAVNPVSGLRVTSKTRTSVNVAWTASKNATSYKIIIDNGALHVVNGTSYSFANLKPGTTHTIHMHAEPAAPNYASASVTVTLPK